MKVSTLRTFKGSTMQEQNETISQVVSGLLSCFQEGQTKAFEAVRHNKVIQAAYECAKDGQANEFYDTLLFPIEAMIEGLIDQCQVCEEVRFILKQSQYLEGHIQRIFEKFEGRACCYDKTKTVIRALLKYYREDIPIEFDYDQQYVFHLPKIVLTEQDSVIGCFEGLYDLYYGYNNKYLDVYKGMLDKLNSKKTT